MQRYLAALTIVVLLGMVLVRVAIMRRQGVRAMSFGKQDKTDFFIPPFAFFDSPANTSEELLYMRHDASCAMSHRSVT